MCPSRGFWPTQKQSVFSWMGLAQPHRCTMSQRCRGRNFAPSALEMLLLHPAWAHLLSRLLREAQTLRTPPNLFPCPLELFQHHSGWPGAARVLVPRDALCSLGVTIVTEQHLRSPAGNLLFHPALRWTLSNSFLPLCLP